MSCPTSAPHSTARWRRRWLSEETLPAQQMMVGITCSFCILEIWSMLALNGASALNVGALHSWASVSSWEVPHLPRIASYQWLWDIYGTHQSISLSLQGAGSSSCCVTSAWCEAQLWGWPRKPPRGHEGTPNGLPTLFTGLQTLRLASRL